MSVYAPTVIDVSRLPAPEIIEALDFETLLAAFKTRFLTFWNTQRAIDPSLPAYDTLDLETDPAVIVGEAWSYLRLLDRQRVNDGYRALLAPLATGSNLDVIAATRNVERLTVQPATSTTPAVMESDPSLLLRYMLSYDVPAAGSAGRYLFDAWSAWPHGEDGSGMHDARVNGYAIHGRRGDSDLVITGAGGRVPTTEEILTVRAAVTDINRAPDGVAITVMAAQRVEYAVSLVVEVPGNGPAPEAVRAEAEERVRAAAAGRMLIGGEIPEGLLAGAGYGANVIRVRDLAPVVIVANAYKIPVMTSLSVTVEVRT